MVRPSHTVLALLMVAATVASSTASAAEPLRPVARPRTAAPAAPKPAATRPSAERAVVETIQLTGFDPEGEPQVQRLADGSLRLLFEFMPPSFTDGHDASLFAHLDARLSTALGVEVLWEDRETLLIAQPKEDTLARIKTSLAELRGKFP